MENDSAHDSVSYHKLSEQVVVSEWTDPPSTLPPPDTSNTEDNPQYTIDEAIERIGFGFFQIRLSIFSALVWIADAMEMMMLAVLGPAVQCLWSLTSYEVAMVTTVVFIGMGLGSAPWGIMCDKFGRKRVLFVSTFFVVYFGFVTAFAPSFYWLITVRFFVGVCIGGAPQSVTYFSEFLPIRFRSPCIVLLEFAWAIGSCFEALLALLVMDTLGWRYLVALSALPVIAVLFYFPLVPPSPRFLLTQGRIEEAKKILESAARQNRRRLPPGELVLVKRERTERTDGENSPILPSDPDTFTSPPHKEEIHQEKGGNILELFSRKYRLTTVMLLLIWFGCGFGYYGAVLVTTELFVYDKHCGVEDQSGTDLTCHVLTQTDYLEFLITSAAEFPGIFATLILSDLIGRKLTMTSEFFVSGSFYLLLIICTGAKDKIVKTAILFIIRGAITGAFQAAYVYTPEAYPTRIRASALSLCSAMARVGALITPFIATVLLQKNFYATICVYSGVAIVSGVLSFLLPFETKGLNLGQEGKRKFLC